MQCLGPEATEYLKQRLPVGSSVHLEYDVERTDKYERTLAGVFHNGEFINAEIARAGYGVAVLFEPNDRFYEDVREAQEEASVRKAGLFSPEVDCSIPGQVQTALEDLSALTTEAPATAQEASAFLAGAVAAISVAEAADALLHGADESADAVRSGVRTSVAGTLAPKLATAVKRATKRKSWLKRQQNVLTTKERKAAEKAKAEAAAAKRAEQDRKAAIQKAEEVRKAKAQREAAKVADRKRAAQEAARIAEQRAERQAVRRTTERPAAPERKTAPKKSSNPYPGYTGPRCYAPGGKSWKPCP